MLRRANDCITEETAPDHPEMIFDAFWRRGELALMFGEDGVGKSFVAVQIADALAGGRDIPSFRMDCEPDKVLYVDMAMTDEQFARRYVWRGYRDKPQPYSFSARFYRDPPPSDDKLVPWLTEQITGEKIRYVIIDDLSAVMRTCDGTSDTLGAMRELRRLRDKFNVSILVLMPSARPGRDGIASESDLGRQRSLCRVADSVFAVGRHNKQREWRYMMQTRSRNAPVEWTAENAWWATFGENINRLKGLNFADRTTEEEKELISKIYSAKSSGKTFREIGIELGISKSRASRLHQRWGTAAAGWRPERSSDPPAEEDYSAAETLRAEQERPSAGSELLDPGAEDPYGVRSEFDDIIDGSAEGEGKDTIGEELSSVEEEFASMSMEDAIRGGCATRAGSMEPAASGKILAFDPGRAGTAGVNGADSPPPGLPPLETVRDHNGWIRYIQERFPDGKPRVWYQFRGDDLRKYIDSGFGISGSRADPSLARSLWTQRIDMDSQNTS